MEGISLRPEYIDLYYIVAGAYVKSNKSKEAFTAYEKYVELAGKYDDLAISADRSIEMSYLDTRSLDTAYTYISNEFYRNHEYEKSYEYAKLISDEKVKTINSVKALLKLKNSKK